MASLTKERFLKVIPKDQHKILLAFLDECEGVQLVTKSNMQLQLRLEAKDIVVQFIKSMLEN